MVCFIWLSLHFKGLLHFGVVECSVFRVSGLPLTSFRQERTRLMCVELQNFHGGQEPPSRPPGWAEGSARAACMEKPFSPGNQGGGSDGAAVPVRGNETELCACQLLAISFGSNFI